MHYSIKPDIFLDMEDYERALPLYEKALKANDSISVSIYNKQVNFIRNTHATEKIQLQTLRFRYYISMSVLILMAVIIIVLLIFPFLNIVSTENCASQKEKCDE